MDDPTVLRTARSVLSVPGDRPERFAKASASGADLLMLDLEDSVRPAAKAAVRENVVRWLAEGGTGMVRINAYGTEWYADDVAALADQPRWVLLPKVAGRAELEALASVLAAGSRLVALIETAAGVLDAADTCRATGLERVMARSVVVAASAAAGLAPPIDGPTVALHDDDVLRADLEAVAALGFTGKLCLHPRQLRLADEVLTPTAQIVTWAEKVLGAVGVGGVELLDGAVIAPPAVVRARLILERAAFAAARQVIGVQGR
ncbi:aldolase/citrate lyase family protein [Kribbella sp. NPDC056861]|uniref:HpcH/HpaI aldolase/citrate lyase family protein n=1 Tax=Kribbella sp. NPDC056861 TaxID=3154857 RepID=UPI00343B6F52